jgi:hypothetical protein
MTAVSRNVNRRAEIGAHMAAVFGHASAALTLDRYGHLLPGQAEQVALRLDNAARLARPVTAPRSVPLASAAGPSRDGHGIPKTSPHRPSQLRWSFVVVGTGVDPVTPRFSGANRSSRRCSPTVTSTPRGCTGPDTAEVANLDHIHHTIATHRDQIERTLQRDSPALSR